MNMEYMRIALDPTSEIEGQPALKGAAAALKQDENLEIVVPGNREEIEEFSRQNSLDRLIAYDAGNKKSKAAPLRAATDLLKDGVVNTMVTANNTRLVVASVKRKIGMCVQEIQDPPIIIPMSWIKKEQDMWKTGTTYLLDAGANTTCTQGNLEDFAVMAELYLNEVLGIKSPRRKLLTPDSQDIARDKRMGIRIPWITKKDGRYVTGHSVIAKPCGEATPETLLKAAVRARRYAETGFNVSDTRVALVNIGEEVNKGRTLEQETFKLLEQELGEDFVGNAEPEPMYSGFAGIYVTDDYTAQQIASFQADLIGAFFLHLERKLEHNPKAKAGHKLLRALFNQIKKDWGYTGRQQDSLLAGNADIYSTDGFTGNILLKTGETVLHKISTSIKKGTRQDAGFFEKNKRKIGLYLTKPVLREIIRDYDPATYGGAPLLGLNYYVIKCHSKSNARAFENAIKEGANYARSGIIPKMKEELRTANVG